MTSIVTRKGDGITKMAGLFMMAHGAMHAFLLTTPAVGGRTGNFITQNGTSWLFGGLGLEASVIDAIGCTLVLITALGWMAASVALLSGKGRIPWRELTLFSSVLSILTITAFWNDWMVAAPVIDVVALLIVLSSGETARTKREEVA